MKINEEKEGDYTKRHKWGSFVGRLSVNNSLLVNLISIFIITVGLTAMFTLRREAFPNISFDLVTINTAYPGASPKEIEKLVTIPLEDELREVDDIKESNSVSMDGLSVIIMEIDPDAPNKGEVVDDIRRAVDRVNDLPQDLPEDPLVTEIESRNTPVIEVSMSGQLTESQLQKYARLMEDRLEEIKGVSKIVRSGYRDREFWVEIDPAKAAKHYVALSEVVAALKKQNVRVPGGKLEIAGKDFLLRTTGEFETTEAAQEVIVRANEQGNWVRVKDLGLVRDTFADEDVMLKTNGKRAINLVVIKKEVGDTIDIVTQVKKVIKEYQKDYGQVVEIKLVNDISFYIKRRLGVLVNNGYIGVFLVLVSLFVFLSPSVALLTALGIPFSFMTTFAIMGYFNLSINLISMFGLILVLGMVVDDAIVIAENSFRYIEKGFSRKEAAIRGVAEVAKPVTATIATTIAAFSPLFFMTGIMGKFVRTIPIVVIIALLASLFEALIILPSHIADFSHLKRKKKKQRDRKQAPAFRVLLSIYNSILKPAVHFRYLTILLLLATAAGAFYLQRYKVPFVLFPKEGIEIFFVRGEAPIGTSLAETNKLIKPVEELLLTLPAEELDSFVTTVGLIQNDPNDAFAKRSSHYVQVTVYLTPEPDRQRKANQIIDSLRQRLGKVTGFEKIYFERVNPGPPVGSPVVIRFAADEFQQVLPLAIKTEQKLKAIAGVSDVRHDYEKGQKELIIDIDEKIMSRSFLTVADVALAIRTAFEGTVATSIKKTDEEIDVRVRFPEALRKEKSSLEKILILNRRGNLIPLSSLATIRDSQSIAFLRHLDSDRVISVTANVDEKIITSSEVNKQMKKYCKEILAGNSGVKLKFGGEQQNTEESLSSLFRAFGIAFFMVFMILAATFNSVLQPLVILLAVPFGLIGVVIAFFLHGWPLSFLGLLGVVGLTGVVVNDSIILVDFINQLRKRGLPRRQSIIEASQTRLRPVVLTTITTVVGLLPVAYGWGGGDPFLKPMALAVTYGLLFATLLTLVVIPCIYAIIDDFVGVLQRFKPSSNNNHLD